MEKSQCLLIEPLGRLVYFLYTLGMIPGRAVAVNTIIQVAGRAVGLILSLVTLNYIANHLVVDGSALVGYGQYTIVFTYATIAAAAADLGLFNLLVRDIAGRDAQQAGRLIGNALWFRLFLLLIVLGLFVVFQRFLPYPPVVIQGILIGLVITFSTLLYQAIAALFQANLLSPKIVWSELAGKVVVAGLTIFVLTHGGGLLAVLGASLAGSLVTLLVGFWLAGPHVRIDLRLDLSLWRRSLVDFLPLAGLSLLGLVHFKIDTLILSLMRPIVDVGIYGAAYKVLEVVLIVPAVFASNLLPVMSALADANEPAKLIAFLKRTFQINYLLSLYFFCLLFALAPWLITFLTQNQFLAAAEPLRLLAPAVVFIFGSTLLLQGVIAARKQKQLLRSYCWLVVVDIILNLILINQFSYRGAAIATLVTEALLFVVMVTVARRQLGLVGGRQFLGDIFWASGLAVGLALLGARLLPAPATFGVEPKLVQGLILALVAVLLSLPFIALMIRRTNNAN